ncbi:hypothetical protein OHA18_41550 [Kribbella sp. NBC_00709]|uniref:hypothetical protein n=1 Tax=Kribbella sp. NBC_00709 TaxID=2975972 RepID=UPI002E2DBC54|nr:hypothetical protein [Kribbella sp. NBC_00709]
MESGKPNAEIDDPRVWSAREAEALDDAAWSIRKLIGIVDEAIDAAGAQLARSAALWADSPTPFDERDRPVRRPRPRTPPAQSLLEEPGRDISLT